MNCTCRYPCGFNYNGTTGIVTCQKCGGIIPPKPHLHLVEDDE